MAFASSAETPPDQIAGDISPAIWCSGLAKAYGRRPAVRSVAFDVHRGEVVGLLGPNGAGKTSVIKMILGLVRPDAGEVLVLGRRSTDPYSRRGVGYLPELFRYQSWLSADEVVTLHCRLAGIRMNSTEREALLARVGLGGRSADHVGTYSKGMQQRLGLAVALIGAPELVILDEPTSALDPLGRVDVREIVLDLRSRGTAVLINSHLIGEVERVCDRVVILDQGAVAAAGSLAELLGQAQVRLHLENVTAEALARMHRVGSVDRNGNNFTVALGTGEVEGENTDAAVAALVRDLVGFGVDVFAVEPARISLEDRLLGILRAHPDSEANR